MRKLLMIIIIILIVAANLDYQFCSSAIQCTLFNKIDITLDWE